MKRFLFIVIYSVVSIVLETTLLTNIPHSHFHFNFIILMVAYISFALSWSEGVPSILFMGLLQDSVSLAPFGVTAVSYLLIFFLVKLILGRVYFNTPVSRFIEVSSISVLDKLVVMVVVLITRGIDSFHIFWVVRMIPQAVFNGLFAVIWLPVIHWYINLSKEKFFKKKEIILK